jgi:hypothetical protein
MSTLARTAKSDDEPFSANASVIAPRPSLTYGPRGTNHARIGSQALCFGVHG